MTLILLMAMGTTYLIWFTNTTGPVFQIAKAGTMEFGKQIKDQLTQRGFDIDGITDLSALKEKAIAMYNDIMPNPQNAPSEIELEPVELNKSK